MAFHDDSLSDSKDLLIPFFGNFGSLGRLPGVDPIIAKSIPKDDARFA
jgi:hypothetical protein